MENKKNNANPMAIVAYILFFVPLLTEDKNDPFVMYHVKQSIVLLIVAIAVAMLGSIIPLLGWFIIMPFGSIAVFVLWIMGLVNAATGKKQSLPLIGQFADKISL